MQHAADKASAAEWAWRHLQNPNTLILDTETTGLGSLAEICQIAIIDLRGTVMLDRLVKPMGEIPEDATAIHGITTKAVADAPMFHQIASEVRSVFSGCTVLIYNASYDTRLLAQSAEAAGLGAAGFLLPARFEDVMLPYSAWVGEQGRRVGEYRWQRLKGGDHSALGDCLATRRVLFQMAGLDWLCD